VKPVSKFYAQAAVFSGDPGSPTGNKHGFDMRLRDGALTFAEVGYLFNQSPGDRGLVGTYKLGAFVHTGQFDSWDSQAANATHSAALKNHSPDYGVYGVVEQEAYKRGGKIVGVLSVAVSRLPT
jgi:porin